MILPSLALMLSPNLIDEGMCDGKTPERVSLSELNDNARGFEGRCITVAGQSRAGSLVEGDDRQIDGLPKLRVGLYEREGASARSEITGAPDAIWEVTGAVDTCARIADHVHSERDGDVAEAQARYVEALKAAAARSLPAPPPPIPPASVMLAGSCHYQSGPVVWIASHRRLKPTK